MLLILIQSPAELCLLPVIFNEFVIRQRLAKTVSLPHITTCLSKPFRGSIIFNSLSYHQQPKVMGNLNNRGVSRQKIWNSLLYKLRETFGLYRLIYLRRSV